MVIVTYGSINMVGAVGQGALAEIGLQNLKSIVDISRVARVAEPTGCASIFS